MNLDSSLWSGTPIKSYQYMDMHWLYGLSQTLKLTGKQEQVHSPGCTGSASGSVHPCLCTSHTQLCWRVCTADVYMSVHSWILASCMQRSAQQYGAECLVKNNRSDKSRVNTPNDPIKLAYSASSTVMILYGLHGKVQQDNTNVFRLKPYS